MLKIWMVGIAAAVFGVITSNGIAASPHNEKTTTASDQKEVAVTVYNENLALVKDARKVKLERGFNKLAWREVSAQIRPETAQLRNLAGSAGFHLQEQNFDFDLLTPEKLLEKYLGKEITVIRTNPATGVETRETSTVLATSGPVLRFADRIETGVSGRLVFPGVPDNLRDRPTLVISLTNPSAGEQNLELSYLTSGLSWRADYVAELNERDDHLDLSSWITLVNQSGAAYPNARLQLVAGDVNQVQRAAPAVRGMAEMQMKTADMAEVRQEALFEYHLYTLQHTTTLADNQTKQVALMSAGNIATRKEFLLQGADYYYSGQYGEIGNRLKVGVFVEFQNKGEGLGIPLPKGVMRIYKRDSQGNAQFVGEDEIKHTPKNETVRLKLGEAFDVTADRKQTDFHKHPGSGRHNHVFETAYQIVCRNAKSEAVTVTVREPLPGDWSILAESHPHTKVSASVAEWKITIPADGQTILTYRARARY